MASITLRQASSWCGGKVDERYAELEFLGACNDTRVLKPGQLFVALSGARDGHDFIPAAMERGAAAVLCSRQVGDYPAIVVKDPRKALGDIAREELRRIRAKVVAVTGSVGKSTTKEMIAEVLRGSYRVSKTPANHNNDIGMPMAILEMSQDTQVAVLEMGMNHFREIAYLSNIARPDVAVIVNIGTAHMEFLGSQEGIRRAKLEITEGMDSHGMLLLNGDDTMLRYLDHTPSQRITYFGCSEGCGVMGAEVKQEGTALRFRAVAGKLSMPIEMELEGEHFVNDALAAVAVGLKLAVPSEVIIRQLKSFRNLFGRQDIFQSGEYTIIQDCYNASPESMTAALGVLGNRPGRHIAVLGDMLELGDCANAEHYKVGRIAAEKADIVLTLGEYASRIIDGAITGGMQQSKCKRCASGEELVKALKQAVQPGDVILFKASHGVHMERMLKSFLEDAAEEEK